MDLRAFSARQPWASLLMSGVKKYEVRSWKPPGTGLFLVHASSRKAIGMPELRRKPLFLKSLRLAGLEDESQWIQSSILGVVRVSRIWEPGHPPPKMHQMDDFLCGTTQDVFLWEVSERWAFPQPIPCHGKLNLWRIPEEIKKALASGIRQAEVPTKQPSLRIYK